MENYMKGQYLRSIYESEKGYVIGIFKVKETNDPMMEDYIGKEITFTGYFSLLNKEDRYTFYGEAINHPRYGFQYQVKNFERMKPDDIDGIVEFLSSDLFKGIGEALAKRIVDVLGENTLDLILEEKENLFRVPKISKKKAELIYNTLIQYEESHKSIVYLSELGFTMRDALLIYHRYTDHTISVLEHNPYQVLDDLPEISFLKLDEMREKLGILEEDERRIQACILYCMKTLLMRGDTYFSFDEIVTKTKNYLKLDFSQDFFDSMMEELSLEGKIVKRDNRYYLTDIYEAEWNVAEKLAYLKEKQEVPIKKIDQLISNMEEGNGIIYNEHQKEAIKKALSKNVLIITGGPGTGKTTIIKAIVEAYQLIHKLSYDELISKLALLAPTGRASKRMSEATLLPATTIHRFLKWNRESNEFSVNEWNPDPSSFIIVDEASMIDLPLFDHLLRGLTNHIQLVLVGDYNQLPSVGPGQVLRDLIESNTIDTIHLELLYRQKETSYIPELADRIHRNTLDSSCLEPKSDFLFLECSKGSLNRNLKDLCQKLVDKDYDYKRVQVMAPMYAGISGIDQLNRQLQDVFNPRGKEKVELQVGETIFRENDKILQLVNQPDDNVFNGDVGVISKIILSKESESHKNEIYVDYDGNVVKYLPKDFINIKHGFIISIHKSQGSEFEFVIMPILSSYHRMLFKKLIYTGVTRAKRKLVLLGEVPAFFEAIKKEEDSLRNTSLKEVLENCINPDHLDTL